MYRKQRQRVNSNFIALVKMFMEPSDCDEIPLYKMLYFVVGTEILAEYSRWGCTIDHKMVVVPVRPPYSYWYRTAIIISEGKLDSWFEENRFTLVFTPDKVKLFRYAMQAPKGRWVWAPTHSWTRHYRH
jgi:hypothetical protein